jgi:glycosyltransferase involved in cell wall biosynthesis
MPAYNADKYISQAIDSIIEQTFNEWELVIADDCSTDNTIEIVKQAKINCITNTFNLGYAWAIQTGLKYAKYHQYDYAILMDADGQHLINEANKLYDTAVKTKSDIVIGSRYLKNLGYPCPFFRRIGTKFFSKLIRLFTKQKITDPLSGFQCLNKSVIDYYSRCGNYPEYPDANLIIEMLLKGYCITEIPVKMRTRENGTSMHSGIIKPIKYMVTELYTCIVIFVKYAGKRKVKHA